LSAGPKKRAPRRAEAAAARRAAAEATQAAEGRPPVPSTLTEREAGWAPTGRPSDVFGGELPLRADVDGPVRRRDMFSLLVLHLISRSEGGASYGNQLIERIEDLTRGAVVLNPNTMYPLLRELEQRGLVEGRWEQPQKRSRRLYSITAQGAQEYERLKGAIQPFLDSIVESITLIKREIYGARPRTVTTR
jgi:PadR family transcriptional regulator, regulatory protein PadR